MLAIFCFLSAAKSFVLFKISASLQICIWVWAFSIAEWWISPGAVQLWEPSLTSWPSVFLSPVVSAVCQYLFQCLNHRWHHNNQALVLSACVRDISQDWDANACVSCMGASEQWIRTLHESQHSTWEEVWIYDVFRTVVGHSLKMNWAYNFRADVTEVKILPP